jgi:hypothetical protein
MKFECPHCNSNIVDDNKNKAGDLIIKSRLVFLNEDGNILCRCQNCKKIVGLPLNFTKASKTIKESPIVDI